MNYDYLQFQTEARFFEFNEELFTERNPTATGLPRKGLNIREIAQKKGLPPCITDKIKLEVTANNHVTLGLPSTLLGPKYFDLINEENFDDCLQILAEHGLIHAIDVDGIRNLSKVVRLETACDVIATTTPKRLDYYRFRAFLKNAYRWKRIEPNLNSFGSIGSSENFKIYGKTREMGFTRHSAFKAAYGIIVPENMVRIEYRLTSAEKVRRHYGSKRLMDVLQKKDNVLGKLINDAFIDINPSTLYQAKESKPFKGRLTLAEENAFDLHRIQVAAQGWGKHKAAKLRDINQAIIATEKEMQQSGNILKELVDLQVQQSLQEQN